MIDHVNYLYTFMNRPAITPTFYLSLLEFLLSGKQQVIAVGAEFGLTSMQVVTLLLIDKQHARPMKDLSTLFHCDASNMTGIIDGLEQKGLVSRQNHPKDRRIKVVCIEPAGERMRQEIIEGLIHDGRSLFDPLSSEELAQFIHAMKKLAVAKKPD